MNLPPRAWPPRLGNWSFQAGTRFSVLGKCRGKATPYNTRKTETKNLEFLAKQGVMLSFDENVPRTYEMKKRAGKVTDVWPCGEGRVFNDGSCN